MATSENISWHTIEVLSLNIIFLFFHTADLSHKDCLLMITTNNNHMDSHLEMKKTTIHKLSAVHQIPLFVQSQRHLLCGPGIVLYEIIIFFSQRMISEIIQHKRQNLFYFSKIHRPINFAWTLHTSLLIYEHEKAFNKLHGDFWNTM